MLRSTSSSSDSSRQAAIEQLLAERARRQKVKSDRLTRYRNDPVGFVELGLLGFLWSKQKRILEAVRDNRHVAVKSCHDVGKSKLAAYAAAWWLSVHEPGEAFVITLAPTGHQVKAILWREMNRIHAAGNLPGYMTQTEWKLMSGELVGMGRSPKDTDPTAIQGIHARYVLLIFDEACGIAKQLWDAAESLVANEDCRFLAIGNPDDPSSEFATVCKPGSGWLVETISAFESPNFTDEAVPDWLRPLLISQVWVAERERKWGKTSPLYISKVLGQFPEQASDGLIPLRSIAAALVSDIKPGEPIELGVDVARFGDDHTVIYKREGDVAQKLLKENGRDTMKVTGYVVRAQAQTGATRVKIDDTGLGGGVTDRLRELQAEDPPGFPRWCEIVPINAGEGATNQPEDPKVKHEWTERFVNLRTQLNWDMRDRFIAGRIRLLPDMDGREDEDLQAQAGDVKYEVTSRGQIKLETKEDMKKRGRPSPDDWDALVLAYADTKPAVGDFFAPERLLIAKADGMGPLDVIPRNDVVFAVVSTAIKTGKESDSAGAVFFGLSKTAGLLPLTILDWSVTQIEGSSLETWFHEVFERLQELAAGTRLGSVGVFIDDKGSGAILLQQAINKGWPANPIDSKLTEMGKDERAVAASPYVFQDKVKLSRLAYEKAVLHKMTVKNHLLAQVIGFSIGSKDPRPAVLLDCFCFGIVLGLGNSSGV